MLKLSKVLFILIPVSFILILASLNLSSAILRIAPEIAIDRWACYNKAENPYTVYNYAKQLKKAHLFAPLDSDVVLDLAKVSEWLLKVEPIGDQSIEQIREQSIEYYRMLVGARPMWSTGWLGLAKSKLINKQLDKEYNQALMNAYEIGKAQTSIQRGAVRLGIISWLVTSDKVKALTKARIIDLSNNDQEFYQLVNIALRYNWIDNLKDQMVRDDRLAYIDALLSNKEKMKSHWVNAQQNRRKSCA